MSNETTGTEICQRSSTSGWTLPMMPTVELSGSCNGLLSFVGKLDANKVGRGIEIFLSRFINYTKVAVFISLFVRDDSIHFSFFQVTAIIVLHADYKLKIRPFATHGYSLNLGSTATKQPPLETDSVTRDP